MSPIQVPKLFTAAYFGFAKSRPVAGVATLLLAILALLAVLAVFKAPSFFIGASCAAVLVVVSVIVFWKVCALHPKGG